MTDSMVLYRRGLEMVAGTLGKRTYSPLVMQSGPPMLSTQLRMAPRAERIG
jgi:hypothetical protein